MRTGARESAWIRAVWHHVGTNSADRGALVQVAPWYWREGPSTQHPPKRMTRIPERTSQGDEGKATHKGTMQTPTKPRTDQCDYCHGSLNSVRPWQRFCSDRCRNRWHAQEQRQARAPYQAAVETTASAILSALSGYGIDQVAVGVGAGSMRARDQQNLWCPQRE